MMSYGNSGKCLMVLEISTLFQHLNVASLPHRLGWEDTTFPRAAVANDAMPRFSDEPWA